MTVENGPSIRFDPPLNSNEYVRDMVIRRIGNGQVQVKTQICKFTVQRTNCDEAVSFYLNLEFLGLAKKIMLVKVGLLSLIDLKWCS